jgi:polysaccharide deacetylase 2 family uncharacterized protein YibQ
MTTVRACLLALFVLLASGSAANSPPRIAIIIDDLGYRLDAGRRAVELPGPISFAVLPGTPGARSLAVRAFERGKEVLLHLPLQAMVSDRNEEPLSIRLDITRHPGHMRWLMEEIQARDNLFFVDSFTTHESIAIKIADETGVDARKRDVFLDPDQHPETVAREFERMKQLAVKRGSVIVIGHPHSSTLDLLERELPKLEAEGFELVTISELVRDANATMSYKTEAPQKSVELQHLLAL